MAKKSEVDAVTDEHVERGGILVKLYFDVQDKESERLQPLLVDLINNRLLKEKGIVYCYGKIKEPIKSDELYVTSAEVTTLFTGLAPLISVVFNYAPMAIELVKPEKEFHMKTAELQSVLLDLSSVSLTYSRYMLERIMKREDIEQVRRQIENRIEMGKRTIEDSKNDVGERSPRDRAPPPGDGQ